MTRRTLFALVALGSSAGTTAAEPTADAEATTFTDTVEVQGRVDDLVGIADSAGEGYVGAVDLARRPLLRSGELLEAVPGVISTQHSGGGKANQYFLRGFNLDHGTDFRISVDGIPVNMPSHGHGQGYADINFLIPELIASERFGKGPYDVRQGDFATAGHAQFELLDRLDGALLRFTPGADGYRRFLAADSFEIGDGSLLGAISDLSNDGPWDRPENARARSGLLRWSRTQGADQLAVTLIGYDARWDATDQIPQRALANGAFSRFGTIDATDGGNSSRLSLGLKRRHVGANTIDLLQAYALDYDLDLFSNFTYFLHNPTRGDQFEQTDRRFVLGGSGSREWTSRVGARDWTFLIGGDLRRDDIDNGLFATERRQRYATSRRDAIVQYGAGLLGEARTHWNRWLRIVVGARVDHYRARVDSDLAINSGNAQATQLSPKLSLIARLTPHAELTFNVGDGIHSNDARGATIQRDPITAERTSPADPLVRARGIDLGLRVGGERRQSTIGAFLLNLDSELVFVGDSGTTAALRPSRRIGIELANHWQPTRHLVVDADLALSRARFADDDPVGRRIPGSIETAVGTGVSLVDLGRWFGAARLRYLGPRPLVEDNSQRSAATAQLNAEVGVELGHAVRVSLQGFNLLNSQASDIDYFYESQLRGESTPIADRHFHPAEPRSLRLNIDYRF